jgi:hypothetical protein
MSWPDSKISSMAVLVPIQRGKAIPVTGRGGL